jgi:hypothetical protein
VQDDGAEAAEREIRRAKLDLRKVRGKVGGVATDGEDRAIRSGESLLASLDKAVHRAKYGSVGASQDGLGGVGAEGGWFVRAEGDEGKLGGVIVQGSAQETATGKDGPAPERVAGAQGFGGDGGPAIEYDDGASDLGGGGKIGQAVAPRVLGSTEEKSTKGTSLRVRKCRRGNQAARAVRAAGTTDAASPGQVARSASSAQSAKLSVGTLMASESVPSGARRASCALVLPILRRKAGKGATPWFLGYCTANNNLGQWRPPWLAYR